MVRPLTDINNYSNLLEESPLEGTYFKPEPPYDIYTRGAVRYHKTKGRKYVSLHIPSLENKKDGILVQTSICLARYLYAVKLFKETGELIPEGMEVDHIDDDKTNDTYKNFQLLTRRDNHLKEIFSKGRIWYITICPVCIKQSKVIRDYTHLNDPKKYHVYCCSRSCKAILRSTLHPYMDFLDLRKWIVENQLYQIVRIWRNQDRLEIVKICSEKMLCFDLASACGRSIVYDTPLLLPFIDQCKLVKYLKDTGSSWRSISKKFYMMHSSAIHLFENLPAVDSDEEWKKYIHYRIIKKSKEGWTVRDISEFFDLDLLFVNKIIQDNIRD